MFKMFRLLLIVLLLTLPTLTVLITAQETPIWWQEYVIMRDSVSLDTKIFLPDSKVWGDGPYPALVYRTPYGIGEPNVLPPGGFPSPPFHGYAYVMQDIRGRWFSEGLDELFYNEGADGYDTIEWVASQPWCNGKVGMHGNSASGITTYLAAGERPPHLVACYASVGSANLYNDLIYDGGAFRMADFMIWVLERIPHLSEDHLKYYVNQSQWQHIDEYMEDCREIKQDMIGHKNIEYPYRPVDSEWYMHLPLKGFHPSFSTLQPWSDEILSHPSEDYFRNQVNVINKIDTPIMHIGGWYDLLARSTIDAFVGLQDEGNQKLIMTRGTHGNLGELPYEAFYEWFDYWLKDEDTGIMDTSAVTYYCMGADEWQYADRWIPEEVGYVKAYLHSDGVLNTTRCDASEQPDSYIYDPMNPVLTYGGRNLVLPSGAFDQRRVEEGREDILTYRSEVLGYDIEITGSVKVTLSVSSNCTDTDFTVKLIDVHPDGTAMLVLDNIIRARYRESMQEPVLMQPGQIYEITITLGDISQVFKSGHRVQIDISSSNFPKYDRNLNTGGTLYTETEFNIANNTVYHDSAHLSYLLLPIMHSSNNIYASFDFEPKIAWVNETIIFNATQCYSSDGNITKYNWKFEDENTTATQKPVTNHTFQREGKFNVTLEVMDEAYHRASISDIVPVTYRTDLNKDSRVNILDISKVALAFGSKEGDPFWNSIADLDGNKEINIIDVSEAAKDFGKKL